MSARRRMTKNKKEILALFEKAHAWTVDAIRVRLPHVESSVIYRNLERFVDDGILRTIPLDDGCVAYELASCHSPAHAICDVCRAVSALAHNAVSTPRALPKGFHAHHVMLTVHGTCRNCGS